MNIKSDKTLAIAMIEPVCAHGGMDYSDYALLRGLLKAGVEPRFYTSQAGPLAPQTVYIAETFKGVFGNAPKLYRLLRWIVALRKSLDDAVHHDLTLVHYHFFDAGILERIGVWFARRRGLKIVATIHDVESFHKKRSNDDVTSLLRSLDGIIVHNEVSRAEASHFLRGKLVTMAVIPLGNYIDFVGSTLSQKEARELLGLPLTAPIFLFFGQIKKVKRLDVALKAFALVIKKNPEALLLIAGKMWKDDAAKYQEMIHEYGLADNVVWHDGFVLQERVDWYYYSSDAVVLPYKRIYQSGVLLMAMSYGVPVIASDLPGMKEVITHDDNGYLFAQGDHEALAEELSRLIQRPAISRMIGKRGREYVRIHHDWDIIGKMTAQFYNRILAGA